MLRKYLIVKVTLINLLSREQILHPMNTTIILEEVPEATAECM